MWTIPLIGAVAGGGSEAKNEIEVNSEGALEVVQI